MSGTGAQANMVAGGDGIGQPARVHGIDQAIAPATVNGADLIDAVLRAVQAAAAATWIGVKAP